MNQDIKAKWVAALRSGQYNQITGELRSGCGHCCLGVLCEISQQETQFGIAENLEESGDVELLSLTVRTWAELTLEAGACVTIQGENDTLSNHNDQGKTFAQIANAIESQL